MERDNRGDDRRRQDGGRNQRAPRNRERSRSPHREYRDERRRERSPLRGPRAPARRDDRDPDHHRGRDRGRDHEMTGTTPPSRKDGDKTASRRPLDNRTNNTLQRGNHSTGPDTATDTNMLDAASADEDSDAELLRVMGFKAFGSTKNTKVAGNDRLYGVSKAKTTEYRQYMNRVGGFNRPLSPSR